MLIAIYTHTHTHTHILIFVINLPTHSPIKNKSLLKNSKIILDVNFPWTSTSVKVIRAANRELQILRNSSV